MEPGSREQCNGKKTASSGHKWQLVHLDRKTDVEQSLIKSSKLSRKHSLPFKSSYPLRQRSDIILLEASTDNTASHGFTHSNSRALCGYTERSAPASFLSSVHISFSGTDFQRVFPCLISPCTCSCWIRNCGLSGYVSHSCIHTVLFTKDNCEICLITINYFQYVKLILPILDKEMYYGTHPGIPLYLENELSK